MDAVTSALVDARVAFDLGAHSRTAGIPSWITAVDARDRLATVSGHVDQALAAGPGGEVLTSTTRLHNTLGQILEGYDYGVLSPVSIRKGMDAIRNPIAAGADPVYRAQMMHDKGLLSATQLRETLFQNAGGRSTAKRAVQLLKSVGDVGRDLAALTRTVS